LTLLVLFVDMMMRILSLVVPLLFWFLCFVCCAGLVQWFR
jgi:hypothetical protein